MKRKQKKIGISYAITVNDELTEFKRLINTILPYVDNFKDEIVILQDEGIDGIMRNKKMEIAKFIKEIQEKFNQSKKIYYYTKALINNFAEHKNFLINKCNKEYIFQLDADEYPSETLLKELNNILNLNRKAKIDVIYIPRVNKVKGLTGQHINK
jgi:sulfur relay (sulfurtransferase) DsrC/TusE family protein